MVCDLKNDKHAQRALAYEKELERERKKAERAAAAAAKRAEKAAAAAARKEARQKEAAARKEAKEKKAAEKKEAKEKAAKENNASIAKGDAAEALASDPIVATAARGTRKSPRLKDKLHQVTKAVETKKSSTRNKKNP